jgi:general secretion pathway protein D
MNERLSSKPHRRAAQRATAWACHALCASLLLAGTPALRAQDAPAAHGAAKGGVTLNFVNADIEAVSRAIGAMLNRPIIVDPRVKGQVTVYSEQPLSVREAYLNYLAALRGLGFTVVENAGLLKVVPEADAKLQAGTVQVGAPALRGDQIVTQVFRLNYENANNLVTVLRPLISPNNTINANPGNNTLVITDYADNLQRMARIIAALDTPSSTDVDVIPLKYAVASDMAALVQRLAEGGGIPGAPVVPGMMGGASVTVIADARSNSLIVRAGNAARAASVRQIVQQLDVPSASNGGPSGNIYVVHLKNAEAVKLAQVLRAAYQPPNLSGTTGGFPQGGVNPGVQNTNPVPVQNTTSPVGINGSGGASGGMSGAATAPVTPSGNPQTGGFVQADPASNSLIITAPEPMYRQLRALIDTLDVRRAQVYIESMIVELNGNDAVDFGLQLQGLLGHNGDKWGLAAGTNYGSGGNNILNLTALLAQGSAGTTSSSTSSGLPLPNAGLNVGVLKNYGGTYGLAALAQLLETQGNTNIISTPNLITLDNEEAKVVVGQNVPFVTGQFTSTGTGTTNPFQTIERKDVGITLRIKPQVGDDGTVRMTIYQESSSVSNSVAAGTAGTGPTTDQRVIDTNVVVGDGDVIVLGGLVQDSFSDTQSKVPLLGDIPVIGNLFKSQSRSKVRRNLLVFLRPVVLRDETAGVRLTQERYNLLRDSQQRQQPESNFIMRHLNEAPVLPELQQRPPIANPLAPADTTTPQRATPPATPASGTR